MLVVSSLDCWVWLQPAFVANRHEPQVWCTSLACHPAVAHVTSTVLLCQMRCSSPVSQKSALRSAPGMQV